MDSDPVSSILSNVLLLLPQHSLTNSPLHHSIPQRVYFEQVCLHEITLPEPFCRYNIILGRLDTRQAQLWE
jgi:hypothetical protein